MEAAFADPSVRWAYLCEDDVGLFSLPSPRLADVLSRAESRGRLPGRPIGAVVAYGRRFVGRGSHTVNLVPPAGIPYELVPVDVASWGATLVARSVFDAGIVPDPEWFFGLEDFDFFCRVRRRRIRRAGRRRVGSGGSRRADVRRPSGGYWKAPPDRRDANHGGPTITLATPSIWRVGTGARRGMRGSWPIPPGICRRRQGVRNAGRFSTACGTAPGAASVRTPTMAGPRASTRRRTMVPILHLVEVVVSLGSARPRA